MLFFKKLPANPPAAAAAVFFFLSTFYKLNKTIKYTLAVASSIKTIRTAVRTYRILMTAVITIVISCLFQQLEQAFINTFASS